MPPVWPSDSNATAYALAVPLVNISASNATSDDGVTFIQAKYLPDAMMIPFVALNCLASLLSICGSSCIVYMACRDLNHIMQRILLTMSLADILLSLSSLVMPFSTPSELDIWGASGTFNSCSAVGFFFMTGMATGCWYNAYLSLYYLASVRWNWKPKTTTNRLVVPWWEILVHMFTLFTPLGVNLAAWITNSIVPQEFLPMCFYGTYPWGCDQDDTPDCESQRWQIPYSIANFGGAWMGVGVVGGLSCTIALYFNVRNRLRKSDKFQKNMELSWRRDQQSKVKEDQRRYDQRITQVRNQAVLYSLTFLNSYIWLVILSVLNYQYTNAELQDRKTQPGPYVLQLLTALFVPLKGFLNFFVYTRLKVKTWKNVYPNKSWLSILYNIVKGNQVPPTAMAMARRRCFYNANARLRPPPPENPPDQAYKSEDATFASNRNSQTEGRTAVGLPLSVDEQAGIPNFSDESKLPEDIESALHVQANCDTTNNPCNNELHDNKALWLDGGSPFVMTIGSDESRHPDDDIGESGSDDNPSEAGGAAATMDTDTLFMRTSSSDMELDSDGNEKENTSATMAVAAENCFGRADSPKESLASSTETTNRTSDTSDDPLLANSRGRLLEETVAAADTLETATASLNPPEEKLVPSMPGIADAAKLPVDRQDTNVHASWLRWVNSEGAP